MSTKSRVDLVITMSNSFAVIVFDVNETLSDLSPLADRFAEVGASPLLSRVWFSGVLRDGFALAASSSAGKFAEIARESLDEHLAGLALNRSLEGAIDHIMQGFNSLALHPDVVPAVRELAGGGERLVTLSNGSIQIAEQLFDSAGIRADFDRLLSVEDAPGWKPLRAAYDYAASACSVEPAQMLLVAVHPWDVHGAAQAGLGTAWINRSNLSYPSYFSQPDFVLSSLRELAPALSALA